MECIVRDASLNEMVRLWQEISILESPGTWNRQMVENHLKQNNIHLVAEDDRRIVGSVTAATDGMLGKKMAVLDFVNVLRPYRRKGIGSKLVVEAINRLVAEGKTPIHCLPITTESYFFIKALPVDKIKHLDIDTSKVSI